MKKQIRRMEIEPAVNGGHTVTHSYRESPTHSAKNGMGSSHVEPETHVFGPEDGHEMLAHVANHLNIKEGDVGGEEGETVAKGEEGEE
jgi:hypothetical protein